MKNLILYLALFITSYAHCATDTLEVTSKIKDVTVFFRGAQITRTVALQAGKGKHILIIDQLPNTINDQSIQVNGKENCKILSVKHEIVYPISKKSQTEKDINEKIESIEYEMKAINNRFNVFGLEEKLLMDNRKLNKSKDGSTMANIKEAADYYRKRLNEIKEGKLQLSILMDKKNDEIQELYSELNVVTVKKRNTYSKVIVTIDCLIPMNEELDISYYVSSAGWSPNYDFRVDEVSEPLNIIYNADVFQSSGEKWDKVKLTLSTNNPTLSGKKPELVNWVLGQANPYKKEIIQKGFGALKGRVFDDESGEPLPYTKILIKNNGQIIGGANTDFDGKFMIKPIQIGTYAIEIKNAGYTPVRIERVKISRDKVTLLDFNLIGVNEILELAEVTVTSYRSPLIPSFGGSGGTITREDIARMPVRSISNVRGVATGLYDKRKQREPVLEINYISNSLKTSVTNLEYTIDIPYTIPSDGEDYSIKMKEVTLPVNYVYHTVPKIDEDVFLTAEITNWTTLNLLPGKSNIYYQGTYIGESNIDTENASDTISISLGRDRNIIVKREGNKELFDKRVSGNYIKETAGWDITIRNNKDAKIKIVIEDQFPISDRKSIDVQRIDYSGAKLDSKTGKLLWEIVLNPNEKKEVKFNYLVRYPKYSNIQF